MPRDQFIEPLAVKFPVLGLKRARAIGREPGHVVGDAGEVRGKARQHFFGRGLVGVAGDFLVNFLVGVRRGGDAAGSKALEGLASDIGGRLFSLLLVLHGGLAGCYMMLPNTGRSYSDGAAANYRING